MYVTALSVSEIFFADQVETAERKSRDRRNVFPSWKIHDVVGGKFDLTFVNVSCRTNSL